MKYYQSWLNNSHPDNGSVCCPDGTTIGEPCLAPELQGNTRPKCSGFGAHYLLQRHLDTSETENSLGAPGNQMLSTHYLGFLEEMATMKEEMRRGSKLMDSGMVVMMVRRRMRPWWRGKVSEEMCWLISKGLEYIIYTPLALATRRLNTISLLYISRYTGLKWFSFSCSSCVSCFPVILC